MQLAYQSFQGLLAMHPLGGVQTWRHACGLLGHDGVHRDLFAYGFGKRLGIEVGHLRSGLEGGYTTHRVVDHRVAELLERRRIADEP